MNVRPNTSGVRHLGLLLIACACALVAKAQPCEWDGGPVAIEAMSNFEVRYAAQGYTNTELGQNGQAVCSVHVEWKHDFIENLSLTLYSPLGEQIDLVGPGSSVFTPSSQGARYDVDFVRCADTPAPDEGAQPRFDGSDPGLQVLLGQFEGSYYPFDGCLESFTGPVNGTWRLEVNSNAIATRADELISFYVEFCDISGEGCCEAVTPDWITRPVAATRCVGNPNLLIPFEFEAPEENYIDRVSVTRGDTLLSYQSSEVDLRSAQPGVYTLCGLQIYEDYLGDLPAPGTLVDGPNTVLGEDLSCGRVSDDCVNIVVLPIPTLTVLEEVICPGESFPYRGDSFEEPRTYPFTLSSAGGCDSLVELRLSFARRDSIHLDTSICEGSFARIGERDVSTAIEFQENYTNVEGCDSIRTYRVAIDPQYERSQDTAFCAGGSLRLGVIEVSSAGPFRQNLSTVAGCDSVVLWNILELDPAAEISWTDRLISCSEPSLTLVGLTGLPEQGVDVEVQWRGPNGEDLGDERQILVNAGGYYSFEVEHTFGGFSCSTIDSVLVRASLDIADVSLPDTARINCRTNDVELAADFDAEVDYSLRWIFGEDAGVISSSSTITVDSGGTYRVIATRIDNQCRDTASVFVVLDTIGPEFTYELPQQLTCFRDSVALDARAASRNGIDIRWIDPDGRTLDASLGLAFANQPGFYRLLALDPFTNCQAERLVEVTEDESRFSLDVEGLVTLNCDVPELRLEAITSELTDITWLSSGGSLLASGPRIRIDEPGEYMVSATSRSTGCIIRSTFPVNQDLDQPVAVITGAGRLTCANDTLQLDPFASLTEGAFEVAWIGPDGDIISQDAASPLQVSSPGRYELVLTDSSSRCVDEAAIRIAADVEMPILIPAADTSLTCTEPAITLESSVSLPASELTFSWTQLNQADDVLSAGPTLLVEAEGVYVFTATRNRNGCQVLDTIMVRSEIVLPDVSLAPAASIDCESREQTLQAAVAVTPNDYAFSWATEDGIITSSVNGEVVSVGRRGTYSLTVTDTVSGCATGLTTTVRDTCTPRLAYPDTVFATCTTGTDVIIRGEFDATDSLSFSWSTLQGLIVEGANTATPTVRGEAWYVLRVDRPRDGLTGIDSVYLASDTVAPSISLSGDQQLSCADVTSCVPLATTPYDDARIVANWSTVGGQFCGDTISRIARVNGPGLYELSLVDTVNGCSALAALAVGIEPGVPVPSAGPDRILQCGAEGITLLGTIEAPTPPRQGWWTDAQGLRLTDTGVQRIVIEEPGTFAFVVNDSESGCMAADTVLVIGQGCAPAATPVASGRISCRDTSVVISTPQLLGLEANWTSPSLPGFSMRGWSIRVSEPGIYRVRVSDPNTGIFDEGEVEVIDARVPPSIILSRPGMLTCLVDTVELNASRSFNPTGGDLTFEWYDSATNSIGNSSIAPVGVIGTYTVVVQSERTGCVDSAAVVVELDTLAPMATLAASSELDCQIQEVELSATPSQAMRSYRYAWSGLEGQFLTGPATATPRATQGGEYSLVLTDVANGCTSFDTLRVIDLQQEAISAGEDLTLACRDNTVTLRGTTTIALSNVVWTAADPTCIAASNGMDAEVSCPGDYLLTATSTDGACTYADTVRVLAQASTLDLGIIGDSIINCNRPSILLTARSAEVPVALAWSGVATGSDATATVEQAGAAMVIAIDGAGCTDTAMLALTLDTLSPVFTFRRAATITCSQPSVSLTLAQNFDSDEYSFAWSGEGLTTNLDAVVAEVDAAGQYSLTVTDEGNGCSSSNTLSISSNFAAPSVRFILPEGGTIDCNQESVLLVAELAQGNSFLSWQGPAGQVLRPGAFQQRVRVGGLYQVSATNPSNGCVSTASAFVENEVAQLDNYSLEVTGDIGCTAQAVALIARAEPHVVASWTNDTGDPVNPSDIVEAGIYLVELRDTLSGCSAVDSVAVRDYSPSFTLDLSAPDTLDCVTSLVPLTAEIVGRPPTGLAFSLVNPLGDTVQVAAVAGLTASSAGLWTLLATDEASGCVSSVSTTVVAISESIQNVIVDVQNAGCPGDRTGVVEVLAVEGGVAPYQFSLPNRPIQQVGQFGQLSGGQYLLTVEDATGCTFATTVTVEQSPLKEVALPDDLSVVLGDSVCISPQLLGGGTLDSVRWMPESLARCSTCEVLCFSPEEETRVSVEVWVEGCSASAQTVVRVIEDEDFAWPTAFSPNGDGANDTWQVFAKAGVPSRVRIYNRWGNMVYSDVAVDGEFQQTWDGRHNGRQLQPGVFVVEVEGLNQRGKAVQVYGEVAILR